MAFTKKCAGNLLLRKSMSSFRVAVEWVFGDIVNYVKVHLSALGKMYVCCALIHNACKCLYQSTTSTYFQLDSTLLLTQNKLRHIIKKKASNQLQGKCLLEKEMVAFINWKAI